MKKPNIIERLINGYQYYYVVRFNIVYDYDKGNWVYNESVINGSEPTYGGIVDALISFKYPADKMQAVINNYLLDPKDPVIIQEFEEMQAWRKYSKEYAKEVMSNY